MRLLLLAAGLMVALWLWRDHSALKAHDPRLSTGTDGVVMLTAEWCGYCRQQIRLFDAAGVRYTALDVDTDAGDRAYRALRGRGVPLTVVGQTLVRGFDLDRLRAALAPLGYTLRPQ